MGRKIRLTKEFRFEMAHALWKYDGLCKHFHGHSYILRVTVMGEPIEDKKSPKYGMVMDFGLLKQIVHEEVVDRMDHALVLNNDSEHQALLSLPEMGERVILTQYQPTCENMLLEMAERIKPRLPKGVLLHSLRLNETANSFAEWYAEDNK
ncbi:6-pyruvoyl trahydropterin synthase family protein [Saccharicrinis fermentans]|uniref:6-carboxy-5,6,7,8-tetrahydropterin synthase n=1 Tax=Saccharicrinis fermentans DSM 9555 = JCM 21142 TaxID=869213 RepID=W7Y2J2_9BACT|nr:6-carboxytetrahydropterin synthase [Saccharicrinis fermentans]GAF01763.1 6-carboxy-5,6,7,8-tetrahydropterin synthase [Saccharicrinis fermentans DSM 9555 = JCM 21142]